jgi:hypothetical protein
MTYDKEFRANVRLLLDTFIAAGAGTSPRRVSQRFFGRRVDFDFLDNGKPFRVTSYDWIIASFSAAWPAKTPWPLHIRRIPLAECTPPIVPQKNPKAKA